MHVFCLYSASGGIVAFDCSSCSPSLVLGRPLRMKVYYGLYDNERQQVFNNHYVQISKDGNGYIAIMDCRNPRRMGTMMEKFIEWIKLLLACLILSLFGSKRIGMRLKPYSELPMDGRMYMMYYVVDLLGIFMNAMPLVDGVLFWMKEHDTLFLQPMPKIAPILWKPRSWWRLFGMDMAMRTPQCRYLGCQPWQHLCRFLVMQGFWSRVQLLIVVTSSWMESLSLVLPQFWTTETLFRLRPILLVLLAVTTMGILRPLCRDSVRPHVPRLHRVLRKKLCLAPLNLQESLELMNTHRFYIYFAHYLLNLDLTEYMLLYLLDRAHGEHPYSSRGLVYDTLHGSMRMYIAPFIGTYPQQNDVCFKVIIAVDDLPDPTLRVVLAVVSWNDFTFFQAIRIPQWPQQAMYWPHLAYWVGVGLCKNTACYTTTVWYGHRCYDNLPHMVTTLVWWSDRFPPQVCKIIYRMFSSREKTFIDGNILMPLVQHVFLAIVHSRLRFYQDLSLFHVVLPIRTGIG